MPNESNVFISSDFGAEIRKLKGRVCQLEDSAGSGSSGYLERVYVATYAEAEPYFTGSVVREIYVAADEAYYEGDKSWYKYVPGFGVGLFGIDFNYTEE